MSVKYIYRNLKIGISPQHANQFFLKFLLEVDSISIFLIEIQQIWMVSKAVVEFSTGGYQPIPEKCQVFSLIKTTSYQIKTNTNSNSADVFGNTQLSVVSPWIMAMSVDATWKLTTCKLRQYIGVKDIRVSLSLHFHAAYTCV